MSESVHNPRCDTHSCVDCGTPLISAVSVPRVATSLDDLRVGQVVAWQERNGDWQITVRPLDEDQDPQDPENWEWTGTEVIIRDAPLPKPVPVPRELWDLLVWQTSAGTGTGVIEAAHALVDAVRGDHA